jgi:hypothetical protein
LLFSCRGRFFFLTCCRLRIDLELALQYESVLDVPFFMRLSE